MFADLMENDQYIFYVQKMFKSFLIQQQYIILIRSDSEDMYNVTKHHSV